MNNPKLVEYVRQQLEMGITPEHIRANIASGGWNPADLDDAFKTLGVDPGATTPQPGGAVPVPPKPSMSAPSAAPSATQTQSVPNASGVKYAGFWIRFVAVMVDGLILIIPSIIIGIIFQLIGGQALARFATIITTWVYAIVLVNAYGATLGKKLVGITIKSDDLQKLSIGRIILRETVGKLVSGIIIFIGYIIAAFTGKKQALHDYMAHSVVVYKDPSQKHTAGLIVGIIIACILPLLAILGIFSSIVLVSLNSARTLGKDAQIKANLVNIRAAAEIYADQNGNYGNASDCSSAVFSDQQITSALSAIPTEKTCRASGTTYAVSAKLSKGEFCVDSSGASIMGNIIASMDGKVTCEPTMPSDFTN